MQTFCQLLYVYLWCVYQTSSAKWHISSHCLSRRYHSMDPILQFQMRRGDEKTTVSCKTDGNTKIGLLFQIQQLSFAWYIYYSFVVNNKYGITKTCILAKEGTQYIRRTESCSKRLVQASSGHVRHLSCASLVVPGQINQSKINVRKHEKRICNCPIDILISIVLQQGLNYYRRMLKLSRQCEESQLLCLQSLLVMAY